MPNKIKGTWKAFTNEFVLKYSGKKKLGAFEYGNKVDKRGRVSAIVWHDKDRDGRRDKGESIIAKFKADAEYINYELDYFSTENGSIKINKKAGKFTLHHDGKRYASGKITDMDYFFSKSAKNKTPRRIVGTWEAYADDFIVKYSGKEREGSVKYGNRTDSRGRVSATVWHDKDRDGRRDKGESIIAKYKADAEYISYELDYYSTEKGLIKIDKKNGKFTLHHDGENFGSGKITNMDYFFG